jgi:SAM-dependent methyltransferase
MPADGWTAWELSEALHLAHALDHVIATELLDDVERTSEVLATRHGEDPRLLACLLDLLAARTDAVVRTDAGYRKGPGWGPVEEALILQYVGAYGPNAAALPRILACPEVGRGLVDRARHALAYDRAPGAGVVLLPDLLRTLGRSAVLDVGCGTGALLVEMARAEPSFRGWGVDASNAMIEKARARARSVVPQASLSFRVCEPDLPAAAIGDAALGAVDTVVASSVLNEFFHPDDGPVVAWLAALGAALPGRLLVVADYYGVLGRVAHPPPGRALHDWMQLISGQGVPPSDRAGWESAYDRAGAHLVHAEEDLAAGVFIHLVQLPK